MGRQERTGFATAPRGERLIGAVGSTLAAIARRTGGSGSQCPLPEVRAAMRELTADSLRREKPSRQLAV